jgi:hypothetical protein
MANVKLSQIALTGTPPALTDYLVGVTAANVDQRYTLAQVHSTIPHRTVLTGNTNYYVATTGNDSNPGTIGSPWLTLQHAMDFISSMIDIAGFFVFVNIGAGTFAGLGIKSTVGDGVLQFVGAGPALTTITNGPNDGAFNFGECLDINVPVTSIIGIDQVKLAPATPAPLGAVYTTAAFLTIGDATTLFTMNVNCDLTNGGAFSFVASGSGCELLFSGGTMNVTCGGGVIEAFLEADTNGFLFPGSAVFALSGALTINRGFALVDTGGIIGNIHGSVSGGTVTGPRYSAKNAGAIVTTGSATFFPGSTAGTVLNGGVYS